MKTNKKVKQMLYRGRYPNSMALKITKAYIERNSLIFEYQGDFSLYKEIITKKMIKDYINLNNTSDIIVFFKDILNCSEKAILEISNEGIKARQCLSTLVLNKINQRTEDKYFEDQELEEQEPEEQGVENRGSNTKETEEQESEDQDSEEQESSSQESEDQDSEEQESSSQESEDQDSEEQESSGQESEDQDSEEQESSGQESEDQDSEEQESEEQESSGQESEDQDSEEQESSGQESEDQDSEEQQSSGQENNFIEQINNLFDEDKYSSFRAESYINEGKKSNDITIAKELKKLFQKLSYERSSYGRTTELERWDGRKLVLAKFSPNKFQISKSGKEKENEIYFFLDNSGSMSKHADVYKSLLDSSRNLVKVYTGSEAHPVEAVDGSYKSNYIHSFKSQFEQWIKSNKPSPGSVFIFWGDTCDMNIKGEEKEFKNLTKNFNTYWLGTEVYDSYSGWEQKYLTSAGFKVIAPVVSSYDLLRAIRKIK